MSEVSRGVGVPTLLSMLARIGFRKRSAKVLTLDLGRGWLGWLGLNTASRAGGRGVILLNPIVGVRCQAIEAQVAEGRGEQAHPFLPPTTSEPLRYLVPATEREGWVLGNQGDESLAASLAKLVEDYGLPFAQTMTDLDTLTERLRGLAQRDDQAAYRWLAALRLAGDVKATDSAAQHVRRRLVSRQDRAANELRAFAEWAESKG